VKIPGVRYDNGCWLIHTTHRGFVAFMEVNRAIRNRTLTLSSLTEQDLQRLRSQLLDGDQWTGDEHRSLPSGVVCCDSLEIAEKLPVQSVDLLFLDPPYNLSRTFGKSSFKKRPVREYTDWLDVVLQAFLSCLKPDATVYICGDWLTSASIFEVASRYLIIRNRITWEREKGRGAKTNWKNNSEDIWFCTVGKDYCFNVDDVKHRRQVIAPYRNRDRSPKDWQETDEGNFRDTFPSNLWTDISIPFWSMPENTDHPTQKSEKLLAKLILASSDPGDLVLDPFLGSGTTCVVAKKLQRKYLGMEMDQQFALLALRRLELADQQPSIQGYQQGVFWPRNVRPRS